MDSRYSDDHVGDPTLESQVLSAVMGKEVDEEGFYRIGEKVFNLQRAALVRDGHRGREGDRLPDSWYTTPFAGASILDQANPECLVPGKEGAIISLKGSVVDREKFEKVKDEYYQLRQWEVATGFQTKAKLEELGLADIAEGLEQRGLLAKGS